MHFCWKLSSSLITETTSEWFPMFTSKPHGEVVQQLNEGSEGEKGGGNVQHLDCGIMDGWMESWIMGGWNSEWNYAWNVGSAEGGMKGRMDGFVCSISMIEVEAIKCVFHQHNSNWWHKMFSTSMIAVEAPLAAASRTFASSPFSILMSCHQ